MSTGYSAINKLSKYKPGDYVRADDLNEILRRISQANNLKAASPLEVSVGPYGQHVRMNDSEFVKLAVVELYEALVPCSSAIATVLTYAETSSGSSSGSCVPITCDDWSDSDDPTIDVWDALDRGWAAGDRLIVAYFPQHDKWIVIEADEKIRRFELIEALDLDGSAEAKQVQWTGSVYETVGCPFTVYATLLGVWGPAAAGCAGWAIKCADRNVWEIVFMQRVALFVKATLTSTFDVNFEANATLNYSWRGKHPEASTIVVVLPSNMYTKECFKIGTEVVAAYDEKASSLAAEDRWNIIEIPTTLTISDSDDPSSAVCSGNPAHHIDFGHCLKATDNSSCCWTVELEDHLSSETTVDLGCQTLTFNSCGLLTDAGEGGSSSSSSCCAGQIGGVPFAFIAGWKTGVEQYFGHGTDGCGKWFDIP